MLNKYDEAEVDAQQGVKAALMSPAGVLFQLPYSTVETNRDCLATVLHFA